MANTPILTWLDDSSWGGDAVGHICVLHLSLPPSVLVLASICLRQWFSVCVCLHFLECGKETTSHFKQDVVLRCGADQEGGGVGEKMKNFFGRFDVGR